MFRKHPLRDLMLFLLVGVTLTFVFNIQAVDKGENQNQAQIVQQ